MTRDELRKHRCEPGVSWRLQDARGIDCGRVCPKCVAAVKAKYRPEIFTNASYETSEPIDED